MKTLINAVEEWIDLRIFASSKNAIFEAKFNEMEKIHIRDANRIAELERRVMILDGDNTFDAERATTIESRLDDLECSMEEKTDSLEVEDTIQNAVGDLDLPDSYAIEVMIDDALETKVMDAVKAELDATDFKITVER
tara:strand:- start:367 stop:780 length:414 start_codon:yes stop_codon:yes gene_type:complete